MLRMTNLRLEPELIEVLGDAVSNGDAAISCSGLPLFQIRHQIVQRDWVTYAYGHLLEQ